MGAFVDGTATLPPPPRSDTVTPNPSLSKKRKDHPSAIPDAGLAGPYFVPLVTTQDGAQDTVDLKFNQGG